MKPKEIAVYGGSFNPPHRGHREAARTALETLRPDCFLIMPDNTPPHKELEEGSPSPDERLQLCRLCFSDLPGVEVIQGFYYAKPMPPEEYAERMRPEGTKKPAPTEEPSGPAE